MIRAIGSPNFRQAVITLAFISIGILIDPISLRSQEDAQETDPYTTRLFVTDADGANPKQLTNLPGFTYQGSPEWSVDGTLICFDTWRTNGTTANSQIAVVDADGGNPHILGDGLMPSFSPVSKRIAFTRNGQARGIWIMSADGPNSELAQLDPIGWGTSWAPDGRLAYTISPDAVGNLVIINFVEGTRELLFDETDSPYQLIYWNMAWSPDNKRIAFKGITTDGEKEVGIVDARGEKFGLIRRPAFGDVHESLAWSADGSRILVTKPCPERENRTQVYWFNPDRDEPLQLLAGQDPTRPAVTAACSPDGKKLVISCMPPATKESVGETK